MDYRISIFIHVLDYLFIAKVSRNCGVRLMTQRIIMIVLILIKIIGVTTNDLSMSEGVLMTFIFSSMAGSALPLTIRDSFTEVKFNTV